MAKIYGLFGSMTGKLADTVMAVRNGEQLARKYQPVVFNPSTPAQIAVRAKMKLLSQLSAVVAPAIAIPRVGSSSSRNLFTKKNYQLTTFTNNQADISLANVQLTDSVVGLPAVEVSREGSTVSAVLRYPAPELDRVVYVALVKNPDNTLRFVSSSVVQKGDTPTFPSDVAATSLPVVVYAYGIRLNNENARAKFGNLEAETAETVAKLIVTSTLTSSDITLTETKGVENAPSNAKGSSKTKE